MCNASVTIIDSEVFFIHDKNSDNLIISSAMIIRSVRGSNLRVLTIIGVNVYESDKAILLRHYKGSHYIFVWHKCGIA